MDDPNEQSMDELFGQFQATLQEDAIETDLLPSCVYPCSPLLARCRNVFPNVEF